MGFVNTQIQRVQEQLAGLSASQRMLSGALLVIMVMTMYWWSLYAGKAEMAAVLDQGLSAEDINSIRARLRGMGIDCQVSGDRILVPADRRDEVFADLAFSQMLPQDTRSAFDAMIAKTNPFMSSVQTQAMMNDARQTTLNGILCRFPRVNHAVVMIDAKRERGPNGVEPSATVSMSMRSGAVPDSKLVNAAADLVAGAVANLKRSNIRVIIDGVSYPVRDRNADAGISDDYLAFLQKAEKHFCDKAAKQFAFIEGVLISVSVRPNIESKHTVEHKVDKTNIAQPIISEETETDESNAAQNTGGESGLVPNGRISLTDGAAPETNRSNSERTKIQYGPQVGSTENIIKNPGGDVTVTACSVLIPRSHFAQVYKRRTNVTDREPDAAVLDPFIASELQDMKTTVRTCLGLSSDEAVHVGAYTDLMPMAAGMPPQAAGAAGSLSIGSHAKEIALGALALVSLLMVAGMVRKGTPAPAVAAGPMPSAPRSNVHLAGGEEAIGEAAEGLATLDAMEVDEDSMKAGQMVTQVSQLVGENPDAAANLVKRWLIRS